MNNTVDWAVIKTEYISTKTSYRKLAKKYSVPFSTLSQIAIREKWADLRQQAYDKTNTKIVNTVSRKNAKYDTKIEALADKLLDKISVLIDTKILEGKDAKSISSALKDIKELKDIKSEADIREQMARIAKLEMECSDQSQVNNNVVVEFVNDVGDYNK